MRFSCGLSAAARARKLAEWHPWFAWHPVRLADFDCRWLETIERRGQYYGGISGGFLDWHYRASHTKEQTP